MPKRITKAYLERVIAQCQKSIDLLHELCELEEKRYGIDHNSTGIQELADGIDYAEGIEYSEYRRLMKEASDNKERD